MRCGTCGGGGACRQVSSTARASEIVSPICKLRYSRAESAVRARRMIPLRSERCAGQRGRTAAPPCAAVPAEGAERAVRFRPLLGPPRSYLRSVSCATRAFEAQFECAASHSFVTSGWCASVAVQRHRRGLQCLRWGGACRRVSSTTRASEVVSRIGNLCQVSAQGAVRAHWDSHLR